MADVPGMLQALRPEEMEAIRQLGPGGVLSPALVAAIDAAAGGPGEGRGYYVYAAGASGADKAYTLQADVAQVVFAPAP